MESSDEEDAALMESLGDVLLDDLVMGIDSPDGASPTGAVDGSQLSDAGALAGRTQPVVPLHAEQGRA